MAVDGTNVHICFGAKVFTNSYGGRSTYMRFTNNGTTWNPPVFMGENTCGWQKLHLGFKPLILLDLSPN
jgi:hypothetical protein